MKSNARIHPGAMATDDTPERFAELRRIAKTAPSMFERDNARAELQENARDRARREFREKVARFAGNGF